MEFTKATLETNGTQTAYSEGNPIVSGNFMLSRFKTLPDTYLSEGNWIFGRVKKLPLLLRIGDISYWEKQRG